MGLQCLASLSSAQGSRSVREAMLREFVEQCSSMTAPELERQFCDCASLFLARVTVWLRMSYLRGPLRLLLKTIAIFVSSASGYSTEIGLLSCAAAKDDLCFPPATTSWLSSWRWAGL